MPIGYLGGKHWWQWSRDERMYCAVLWEHGRKDAAKFAKWLNDMTELDLSLEGDWDLGYEVVFYRDYFWQVGGPSARQRDFSAKRTFDLCLFGERDLVIIEAKLYQGFESKQNQEFENDLTSICDAIGDSAPQIHLVGLAGSTYWERIKAHGGSKNRVFFKHRISWAQIAELYGDDPILARADMMYKTVPDSCGDR